MTDAGAGVAVAGVSGGHGQFYYDPVTGARASGAGPTGFYNSQAGTQLLPEITRHNLFGSLEHRVNAALSFFGELSYYDAHSFGQIDSSPISLTTDGIFVPKTNYYNPAGTRFQGPARQPGRHAAQCGDPQLPADGDRPAFYDTDSDSVRLPPAARQPSGTTWTWTPPRCTCGRDLPGEPRHISASRFLQQLALSTPDAYNPFGPPGSTPSRYGATSSSTSGTAASAR